MNDLHDYDSDLRTFRETPSPLDGAHRRFLRWLAERGHAREPGSGPAERRVVAGHGAEQRVADAA